MEKEEQKDTVLLLVALHPLHFVPNSKPVHDS